MKKLTVGFAFEGFRIAQERPWLIPLWGAVMLVFNLCVFGLGFALGGGAPSYGAGMGRMVTSSLLMLPFLLVSTSVMACAVYRCVLDGEGARFAFLRIGGAELRQCLLTLMFVVMGLIVYLAVGLFGSLVRGLLGELLGEIGLLIGNLVIFAACLWLMGRLSLSGPQSYDKKAFKVFESWELTSGHGWTLFLGYMLICLVIFVMWLLAAAMVYFAVRGHAEGLYGSEMAAGRPLSAILHQPVMLLYFAILSFVIGPLAVALVHGAPAAAYRALTGVTTRVEAIF